jgi:hypothetical protein
MVQMDSQEIIATGRASRPEVMISYSSQERPQVLGIVQRLRSAGVAVWIDHGGIDGAQRWGEEIVNAIEDCKTVLVMVSRTSMRSENIAKEVSIASDGGKRLLPLYLEEAEIPRSMRYPLSGIQHIKLYDGDPESKFLSVLRALVRLGVHVSPYYIALMSADSGDRDQAFEWLNKAVDARSGGLARLQTETRFATLRSDARFAGLVKRVEAVQLDPEDSSTQIPVILPRPVPVPTGPVPLWKKVFWPDIYDDRSARFAASLGIWTVAFLLGASFLLPLFLTSLVGTIPIMAMGWNNPLLFAVVFAPIAFGVQKMGRPAAIIGLVLCSLGAIVNLMAVTSMQAAVSAYAQYQSQYNPGYQNPLLAQYYASWFGLIVGGICVLGFANATRGTLAYHQLVLSRKADDKQVAITNAEFAGIKSSFFGRLAKLRGAGQAKLARMTQPTVAAAGVPQNLLSSMAVASSPADIPAIPAVAPPAAVLPVPAQSLVATDPQSFAELIGARGKPFGLLKALAFLVANVAATLTYLLWLTAAGKSPVPDVYWQLFIASAAIFAVVAVVVFRLIKKPWMASAIAGAIAAAATLPFYAALPTFIWGDLIYREQFQQFVLVPFFNSFVFLLALAWAIPRVKPMLFALFLGAMSAEVLTPLFANILKMFGAGQAPDQMLSGTSVIFAVIRSLIFAAAFWGLLHVMKQDKIDSSASGS